MRPSIHNTGSMNSDRGDRDENDDVERSDTASSSSLHKSSSPVKRSRRCMNHLRRFWWIHLIIFLAIILMVTLLVIFVFFPRIAQDDVNDARLVNVSQTVANPTADTIDLTLGAVLVNPSKFTPTLDSFDAALYLPDSGPDRPFGYVTIPRVHATRERPIFVSQTMEIADMDEFTLYNIRTLNSETYEVGISGRTDLHLGGLPKVNVNFTEVTSVRGLNGLRGLNVSDISISIAPAADGTNLNGTVYIPNPSNITVAMGNVTMDLSVDGTPIGLTYIDDLQLVPGDNRVSMRSIINQTVVLSLISDRYTDGVLPVSISGNSSTYNGQTLPYFTAALQSDTVNISLNAAPALQRIGINVTALSDLSRRSPPGSAALDAGLL